MPSHCGTVGVVGHGSREKGLGSVNGGPYPGLPKALLLYRLQAKKYQQRYQQTSKGITPHST